MMFYNWIQSDIHEIIRDIHDVFEKFSFVLVTVIDSSSDMKSVMEYHCKDLKNTRYELCDKGVILTGKDLIAFDDAINAFTGFSEIWCFEEMPKYYPENISLVSPIVISENYSEKYENWMIKSKCILGIGDGMGLNYITVSEEIHKLIKASDE